MEVLQDGVLAFLAATGLAALFWLLTGWLRRREPARVMLLIPARPGCDFAAPAAQMLDLRRQLRGAVPIVLCDCGLVNVRKEGKWSHYSLNCETLTAFRQFIDGLVCRCAQDGEEVVK